MGIENSHLNSNLPPSILERRDVKSVAKYIRSGECQKIVFLCGAGISTSAGIPDFRTPGSGLYYNLQRLNLPTPESVFDISYFRQDPKPFYTLAKSLHPDNFTPTVTHAFIALTANKGLLHKCFTQNIDTLERAAGVPQSKLVEAHGSFSSQRCIECKTEFPTEFMKPHYRDGTVPHCDGCGGLVKPDITFFGEPLPGAFHNNLGCVRVADLTIVMGSSLTVYPFSALPELCSDESVRVLINNERAGGIGSRRDDVIMLGSCDRGVRRLAEELGWLDDLESLWKSLGGGKAKPEEGLTIDDQIGKLTEEVERGLNVASDFKSRVEAQIDAEEAGRVERADNTQVQENREEKDGFL